MVRTDDDGGGKSFTRQVLRVGINPYVRVPPAVLARLFEVAERTRSPIPVKGTLNGARFRQTLVKYQGAWRLYLNTGMRQRARVDVGERATVSLEFDATPKKLPTNAAFTRALGGNAVARKAFDALVPSRKKEIVRYLNSLKTRTSLERNIDNVVLHLTGKRPNGIHAVLRVKPRQEQ